MKILQVRHKSMKIPFQGPCDKHQGESRTRSADNFNKGISATRSKQHCSLMEIPLQVQQTLFNEENIYYILLPTV